MAREEKGEGGSSKRTELETLILQKVREVSAAIDAAKHVDEVIVALHSLAVLLFPVDSSALSGCLPSQSKIQVCNTRLPTGAERDDWRHVFYYGAAFPTVAKLLTYNVASNWLACFLPSARELVYDSFFVRGPSSEIIQALVPGLTWNETNKARDLTAICTNVERLLVLVLIENEGVHCMVEEFGLMSTSNGHVDDVVKLTSSMSTVAQLLASIPDKARLEASSSLSSHLFFRQIIIQLLVGGEERAAKLCSKVSNVIDETVIDAGFLFVGETFSRICRRGSADILVAEMIPRALSHVRSCSVSDVSSATLDIIKSEPKSLFWMKIIETIKDQYAVERLSEELLRQLARQDVSSVEAYRILWLLYIRTFKHLNAVRSMFVDKFLFWRVFPVCCLRWIIQFSVLECPPHADEQMERHKSVGFTDVMQRLVKTWSQREFTQSATMEQQAYITAAVGLCLERMSKGVLEAAGELLHWILQGVSCRLESPIHLVRKMASSIALVFSKLVDPENPLYLDEDCCENVDWEFGIFSQAGEIVAAGHINQTEGNNLKASGMRKKKLASKNAALKDTIVNEIRESLDFSVNDPDKTIKTTMLDSDNAGKEDADGEKSETSSNSSLQPYDLSDDDTDLQKKISQIGDIATALRKTDDPDGVERALDVAERLVRASPDELCHNAADLVRALVHLRCSDVAIEGEEDSAEEKRQKALVALILTSPFESLDVLNKSLYSPNVDVSQRILIIDVMTHAALELADTNTMTLKHQQRDLISSISDPQPWFIPSTKGPPDAGPWKEVLDKETPLSWSLRYERELPSKHGQVKKGKSRRWGLGRSKDTQLECSQNKFPLYAAAFMLPAMQGFDKRRRCVDLLNRDFIVLGKLIHMLGVCMKCMTSHPESSALAPALLDMLKSREVSHHAEAYVRRSVLFAASCILVALHPSFVASALIEGNGEVSVGLEWIRTWALHVAEADPDAECSRMAITCLQLHSEMALQTSRTLESASFSRPKSVTLGPKMEDIIIPFSTKGFQV